jgi:triphosphoribosyl-dephospho-CoA synthase
LTEANLTRHHAFEVVKTSSETPFRTDAPAAQPGEHAWDASSIAAAAQLACLLEVSAPKPGNVSPGRHFADTRYEQFLASAAAIGGPLSRVATRSLGATIRLAIEATGRFTRANTNLGIVLLLTPIARAASDLVSGDPDGPVGVEPATSAVTGDPASARQTAGRDGSTSRSPGGVHEISGAMQALRAAVARVVDRTTVEDAGEVYAAIRLASPGGLGRAEAQDVFDEPTAPLRDVMRLAADRDGIAREYATGFEVTFESGVPALARARADGLPWDDAVVETFVTLLAGAPDTHVKRRGGAALAADVSRRAAAALAAGGVRSAEGRRALEAMDAALRDGRNTANPGTTADLTAAAIFVFLLVGGWDGGTLSAGRSGARA